MTDERKRINQRHASEVVKHLKMAAAAAAAIRLDPIELEGRTALVHVLAAINHTQQAANDLLPFTE